MRLNCISITNNTVSQQYFAQIVALILSCNQSTIVLFLFSSFMLQHFCKTKETDVKLYVTLTVCLLLLFYPVISQQYYYSCSHTLFIVDYCSYVRPHL
jgi:hypothetical protein